MIWWCRSDPIDFSMPYSQIADLTLTLSFCILLSVSRNAEFRILQCSVPVMTYLTQA